MLLLPGLGGDDTGEELEDTVDHDNGPEFELEDDMGPTCRLILREIEEKKAEKKRGFRVFLEGVAEPKVGEGEKVWV